ncbi:hypothetical protein TNCV_4488001 [Trichonephila clavipes]|nr:hypothetical protein TNCV_4488001 [Trichonephila clavipes]
MTTDHGISDRRCTVHGRKKLQYKALVPLNGYKVWNDNIKTICRKCGQREETLPHIINHCKSYSAAWQKRHNAVLARIKKLCCLQGGTVLSENQVVGFGWAAP